MDTAARISALESRIAALESWIGPGTPEASDAAMRPGPVVPPGEEDTFWALDGLRARYPEGGGVLFTGDVALPTGGEVRWQQGALTSDVTESDWSDRADALAALGHPVRLRLLQQVLHGRSTAQELTEIDGIGSTGQVYHHLRQLTAAGWLRTVGGGRHEVPAARVVPLLVVLTAVNP